MVSSWVVGGSKSGVSCPILVPVSDSTGSGSCISVLAPTFGFGAVFVSMDTSGPSVAADSLAASKLTCLLVVAIGELLGEKWVGREDVSQFSPGVVGVLLLCFNGGEERWGEERRGEV